MSNLEDHRTGIDDVDRRILELLAERRRLAADIASTKIQGDLPFHDPEREQLLLAERVVQAKDHSLDPGVVVRLWEQILDDSLRLQHSVAQRSRSGNGAAVSTVVFQGAEGAYSHLAAQRLFGEATFVGVAEFADAVLAVEKGKADRAVLPIENTTSGSIADVYDLLMESRLSICGEVKLEVEHCLLGVEGSSADDIRRVLAHPQAVAQCSSFLKNLPEVEVVYSWDTAGSARQVAEAGSKAVAAIAGEDAARVHGLSVLARRIGNRRGNFTRFLALSASPVEVDPRVPAKTSLVFSVGNEPGSLLGVLREFEGIPMVKLESRPNPDDPWQETFFLDFAGNQSDPRVVRALDGVGERTRLLRVLGSYPSSDLRPHASRTGMGALLNGNRPAPTSARRNTPVARLAERSGARVSEVEIGGVVVGGDEPVLISGPCAVESMEQVLACAQATSEAGGKLLRGGCFKPRTSPYSFQGLGYEALEMLAEAGRAYGLPIVTEVPSPEHVGPMAEIADVLQIGARNMQNFALLSEVGRSRRPVLLKRGMSATIEELLAAAEYILAGGNRQVILCERGIRTFETSTRNTLDVSAVPVLRERTHMPVIVDPSHAAGSRSLVIPLGRAALAAGAHGLMVEIHPDPEKALSDGPQALLPDDLKVLWA